MSGHSKWATIKHKKGADDKARGKLFDKLARQLEVAAREGGGDPDANPTLRSAVQKAKGAQMPNDAIDRAIKRGTGEGDGGTYEAITYEGYAPGGVAMLVDVLTDNRNRTGADVRSIFPPRRIAGRARRRRVAVHPPGRGPRRRRVRRGRGDGGGRRRRCRRRRRRGRHVAGHVRGVEGLRRRERARGGRVHGRVRRRADGLGQPRADQTVEDARKVLRIIDAFEENDDVQDVYANFDIAPEIEAEVFAEI